MRTSSIHREMRGVAIITIISLFFALLSIPSQSPQHSTTMSMTVTAFSIVGTHHHFRHKQRLVTRSGSHTRVVILGASSSSSLHEFDHLLREYKNQEQPNNHRLFSSTSRRVALTDSFDTRTIVLVSSTATVGFPGPSIHDDILGEATAKTTTEEDPYANALEAGMGKIEQFQEQKQHNTLEAKIKSMDLQDIIITFIIPGIAVFAATRWVWNKVGGKVAANADEILDNFAREMILYDGDFTEMELCIKDYKNKLVWMGPARNDAMLKRYLENYAKKKTVSPQAIASLSYVFTVFQLSEEKAAQTLVSLCKQMGAEKISSAGKLLFLGSRILKSPTGVKALTPIKELIMSTYRDATVAESLVETSQQAIAEAAYRSAVLAGGKNQRSLTAGWEVLGLDRNVAERIFAEEQKEGFISDREAMYGGQTRKYDKHGRQIDDGGKLVNPEEADENLDGDEEEEELVSSGTNVFECGECGFTLFVAPGRESKFYGSGFKCPECGAPKKKFKARDDVNTD